MAYDSAQPGHLLTRSQLLHFLRVVGADREADGSFRVAGTLVSFMGAGHEWLVGPDAVYFRDGHPCSLAVGLRGTSYGTAVTVI